MSEPMRYRITVSMAGLVAAASVLVAVLSWSSQIEARLSVVESRGQIVIERLNRIEGKLDRVIEQR